VVEVEHTITLDDVVGRLGQLGYHVDVANTNDVEQLKYTIRYFTQYASNFCNIKSIPEIVNPRVIDRICSDFLFHKKNMGLLKDFDYSIAVRSLTEGDTSITYAIGQGNETMESRFDASVRQLERGFDKWLTPHRRLRW